MDVLLPINKVKLDLNSCIFHLYIPRKLYKNERLNQNYNLKPEMRHLISCTLNSLKKKKKRKFIDEESG